MHSGTASSIATDGGNAGDCLEQFRPRQLCCSPLGHDCSRQSFGTPAIHSGRILKGIFLPRALLAPRIGTLVVAYFIMTGILKVAEVLVNDPLLINRVKNLKENLNSLFWLG
ncbi:MAG: hypothetical protein ACI8W7_002894 [Gammaproteobacteria bacterium]|jgi:hypothetical protein